LEGLAVIALFPSKPSIKVRCSLIDEYVKKPNAHGMSTFNGSSVIGEFGGFNLLLVVVVGYFLVSS
jgi:hypothetical protein